MADQENEAQGSQGAPNGAPRSRGDRQDAPGADAVLPGREFGAGGQKEDGPDSSAGAGAGADNPGGPGSDG